MELKPWLGTRVAAAAVLVSAAAFPLLSLGGSVARVSADDSNPPPACTSYEVVDGELQCDTTAVTQPPQELPTDFQTPAGDLALAGM